MVCLLPWFLQEQVKAINPDIAWLVEGASRFLEGRTMAGAVYDTNPPLSVLINIPALLFKNATGMGLEQVVLLVTMVYAALSAMASFLILRRWPGIDLMDAVVFTGAFGIACTIFSYPDIGQRDQLIAFGLVPFILAQVALTYRYPCARWLLWIVFFSGALLLMLKPNYGLLPTVLLAHRIFVQKRITIFRDPDFIALAATTIGYLALIWFSFHDYIAVIFMDVVELYTRLTQIGFLIQAAAWGLVYILGSWIVLRSIKNFPDGKKRLLCLFMFSALVNLIPYISMMRGFSYHILPSLICFVTGIGFFYFLLMRSSVRFPANAALVTFIMLSVAGYSLHITPQVGKRQVIKELPVTRLARDCGPDCKIWIMSPSLPVTQLTAFYAGKENSSRFPSLWFLKGMKRYEQTRPDKYQKYAAKFSAMMALDLKEYAPDLVISCVSPKNVAFHYADESFNEEWQKYYLDGSVQIDYWDYYFKIRSRTPVRVDCDVYRRIGEAQRA